jgi:hypothetical protein
MLMAGGATGAFFFSDPVEAALIAPLPPEPGHAPRAVAGNLEQSVYHENARGCVYAFGALSRESYASASALEGWEPTSHCAC